MAGTGDQDVAEARVERVCLDGWMDGRIRMDEHALGGQTLGAVAGEGIAMIEMAVACFNRLTRSAMCSTSCSEPSIVASRATCINRTCRTQAM